VKIIGRKYPLGIFSLLAANSCQITYWLWNSSHLSPLLSTEHPIQSTAFFMASDVVSALSPLLIAAMSNYSTIFTVHRTIRSVYKAISTSFNYTVDNSINNNENLLHIFFARLLISVGKPLSRKIKCVRHCMFSFWQYITWLWTLKLPSRLFMTY